MSNDITNPNLNTANTSKKHVVIYSITAVFFLVACYNVYSFFEEKQRVKAQQETQRLEALALKKQQQAKAERQAELEQAQKLQALQQQTIEAEIALTEKKLQQQKRLTEYKTIREAQIQAKDDARLQRRITDARSLNNPEGVPRNILQAMQQATYLTIQNNPDDYRGNYQPQSILKTAKLTDGGANSLMMFAMVNTDVKVIQEVIKLGYEVNTQNKSGYSALMFASAYNTPEVVEFLIEAGADTKTTEYLTEGNALHVSARHNPKPEVIEALVENGFDLETKDKDGNTALLVATKYNKNLQVVETLIELGADIEASDKSGNVAYSYAFERINKKVPMGRFERISKDYEQAILDRLK